MSREKGKRTDRDNAEPFIECCAEPFIALRAIHVGLAPNKSKIKNSWKCINGFRHAIHRMLRILFHGRLAPYKSAKINAEPFIECCRILFMKGCRPISIK